MFITFFVFCNIFSTPKCLVISTNHIEADMYRIDVMSHTKNECAIFLSSTAIMQTMMSKYFDEIKFSLLIAACSFELD